MRSVSWLRRVVPVIALVAVNSCPLLAQGVDLPTKAIIDQLIIDLDQDGIPDRLFLITSDSFADLVVFRGIREAESGKDGFMALPVAKEFAFDKPWLKAKAKGVVTVSSAQSQGRYKWEQMLTLAWRSGRLRVIGITYGVNDSISSADRIRSCDLNLSTGKGVANGKPIRVALKPVPIEDWSDEKLPGYCYFG
jgi:hypothetical protein